MSYSTARSEAAYLAAQEVIAGGVNSGARGPRPAGSPARRSSPAVRAPGSGTSTATSISTTSWRSAR